MMHSCGIIPFRYKDNGDIEFFVGHPGHPTTKGKNYWLYIKGHKEDDEDYLTTAKREFKEETSVTIDADDSQFIYLGEVQQSAYKRCIAFGLYYPNLYPEKCSSSYDEEGIIEIDDYAWMDFETIIKCTHEAHRGFYQALKDMRPNSMSVEGNVPMYDDDDDIVDDSGY